MAVDFREALKIAKKNYPHPINHFEEYERYFVFDFDGGEVRMGGELSPIVIRKEDGEMLNYDPIFFDLSDTAEDVGDIILEGKL